MNGNNRTTLLSFRLLKLTLPLPRNSSDSINNKKQTPSNQTTMTKINQATNTIHTRTHTISHPTPTTSTKPRQKEGTRSAHSQRRLQAWAGPAVGRPSGPACPSWPSCRPAFRTAWTAAPPPSSPSSGTCRGVRAAGPQSCAAWRRFRLVYFRLTPWRMWRRCLEKRHFRRRRASRWQGGFAVLHGWAPGCSWWWAARRCRLSVSATKEKRLL